MKTVFAKNDYLMYLLPALLIMTIFFLYPIVVMLFYGLEPETDCGTSFALANYEEVLTNPFYYKAIFNSILLCLPTTIIAVFISLEPAWYIAEQKAGSYLLRTIFTFSFAFGGIIYGIIFIFLLGNVGIVSMIEGYMTNTSFTSGLAYSPYGLAVAYLLFQIPRSALVLSSSFEKMDKDLIPISKTLGANKVQIIIYVFMPLYKRQIISTIMLIFSMSMASYGVAMLVARDYPIYPVEIYKEFSSNADLHAASAMAIVLFFVVLVMNIANSWSGRVSHELHN